MPNHILLTSMRGGQEIKKNERKRQEERNEILFFVFFFFDSATRHLPSHRLCPHFYTHFFSFSSSSKYTKRIGSSSSLRRYENARRKPSGHSGTAFSLSKQNIIIIIMNFLFIIQIRINPTLKRI